MQARKLPDGKHLTCTLIDRTERKKAEDALHEKSQELEKTNLALEQLATVFTHVREGVIITDPEGTILDVNQAFCRISGYEREEVIGRNPRLLKSGEHGPEFYALMWQTLAEQGHWSGEILNRHKNGGLLPIVLTISAVRSGTGAVRHYVALHTDISALKEHQKQLELLAHYDTLTGLPNRKLFDDRLQQAIVHGKRHEQSLAIAYIDLDGFKSVNDTFGHDAGDQLLKVIAARMQAALRESDTIARFGGDEFVVILEDLGTTHASTAYIKRLLTAAAQPVDYQGQTLQVSSSIGVAFFAPSDTLAADQLLRQADQAMYQAKLLGKNCCHIYDPEEDQALPIHHQQGSENPSSPDS
ncbi:diguanylate cyclase [Pelobacter sp. M08fum]|uniref:Diguanylate cyclase n=1 Tax=Pelovirga terrestris TaxID=2771352 RepID=A0A8J6QTJ5_9BACT|nr:diguanylate cyclase [Pelovirga terrestris]